MRDGSQRFSDRSKVISNLDTLHQLAQIGRTRSLYKFGCVTSYKVFVQLTPLSLRLFVMTESSNKAILRSFADWPRWFVNICDQAKYEYVWDYINPDVIRTATESTGTTGTTTGDTSVVIITITTIIFPFEPSIAEDVLDASFKM